MKILAVETATEACSAALYVDGAVLERYELAPQQHNHLIIPMLDSILAEAGLGLAQLDALAFGRGPGSFTGVRIATGVIQGLAFAKDLPVAPVSTLAALALQAFDEAEDGHAFTCMDARMGEVYWGVYARTPEGVESMLMESVGPADSVAVPAELAGIGIGSGWGPYGDTLRQRVGGAQLRGVIEGRFPRAGHVARLGSSIVLGGACVAAEFAQPVYLRDDVAKKPAPRV
ncbi:tRNA (adenosine(37)-N6)-threonylcarbamoyltransferase complex dimerization subunit type 1 TsaB [Methyloterricola oryzae]|uniref:tRNA (adenosine(37)-N6)-threonylcarbamoyltransferase complex dimerization subunit type 1 TsaB n=1 Tax=Methyloterricola oryzae TaxID=1495050 RepID=UPI0005EBCDBB|nr:tRNA (adenosine(37)-N6)-threonylcarbamoyltransferase complex dimerization subunit type 1 TsaB [Methyloterricola oryzae]